MKGLFFCEKDIYKIIKSIDWIWFAFKKIKFNSKNNYRQLTFNINDEIVFSINNEIFDISKFGLIIQNPFCISLNEKKLLNSLYKELEEKLLIQVLSS